MKLKPYPKYKDSGIKWIGKIPEGWRIRKIKYTSTITMGQSPNAALINDEAKGIPFFQGKADFCELYPEPKSWIEQPIKIARRNEILITVRAPVGALNISNQTCCIGRGLAAIRFHNYKYLYYNLHIVEEPLNAISSGSTFEAIAFDDLKSMIIPLSENVEQQTTIASFLDKKTAKIDTLIEKDKKLIALLKEKRAALINHAVTKGLDPNVKLKDSGIDWIGEIPEGWEVRKLKTISKIVLGKMLTNDDKGNYLLKPYLRAQNISWENVDASDIKGMWFSPNEIRIYRLFKNDLLVSEGGDAGRTAIWNEEIDECYIQNSVHKVTISPKHNSRYFLYMFEAFGMSGYFESIVSRVSIGHLTREKLKEVNCIVPPLPDQNAITNFLDKTTSKIDKTIKFIEKKIKLLEEYKKSLVNHVVTGKVDVRKSEV